MDVIGFNTKDFSTRYDLKTMVRERLARLKMAFDLLFGVGPKFLGDQIKIG